MINSVYPGTNSLTWRDNEFYSEREVSVFPKLFLSRERSSGETILAEKFFTKRALSTEAIIRTFNPLWRSKNGFQVWTVGNHILLSAFDNKEEAKKGQSLATKLIVALGYKLTQYLFIGGEFWQIHHWIIFSSYILHVCKISRKLKINSYVINKFLNCKFL